MMSYCNNSKFFSYENFHKKKKYISFLNFLINNNCIYTINVTIRFINSTYIFDRSIFKTYIIYIYK